MERGERAERHAGEVGGDGCSMEELHEKGAGAVVFCRVYGIRGGCDGASCGGVSWYVSVFLCLIFWFQ